MPQRRARPYIWATWLPRLLTGENSCEWAIWFKAHYRDWTKEPSDFNQADRLIRHTGLLNQQRQEWEAPRLQHLRRRTEHLPTAGQVRHAGRPARPGRARLQGRHHHRRKDWSGTALARPPGHDLPVRPTQDAATRPEPSHRRRGHLPHPRGARPSQRPIRSVHR